MGEGSIYKRELVIEGAEIEDSSTSARQLNGYLLILLSLFGDNEEFTRLLFSYCFTLIYAATFFNSRNFLLTASQRTRAIVTSTAFPINFFWSACVPIKT